MSDDKTVPFWIGVYDIRSQQRGARTRGLVLLGVAVHLLETEQFGWAVQAISMWGEGGCTTLITPKETPFALAFTAGVVTAWLVLRALGFWP